MPIEGLRTAPQPEINTFNLTDEVGASVEALSMLGLVQDRDQVAESLTADFANLNSEVGLPGEPYVQLPRSVISLPNMLSVMDGASYPSGNEYPKTYVYDKLWTPGTDPGSYQSADIGNLVPGQQDANWPAHGRLAVHNLGSDANPKEPLLHFLNKPFDGKYAKRGEETQLQVLAKAQAAYEAGHQDVDLAMTPLNTNAVVMLALACRIKGQPMPLEWGFMNDATLPQRVVGGGSVGGRVSSEVGRLLLGGAYGFASSFGGVGVSVGPKNP